MNNKILISFGIIVVLLGYLLINKKGSTVDLPEMEKWEGNADEIVVEKDNSKIKLNFKNGKWLINDEGYPADEKAVTNIEKKLNELVITDLISEKSHYDMYELDKTKAMKILVKKGGKTLRNILLGKKSTTGKQTYIKLADDKNIYMVSGDLAREFNKKVDDLRDKDIFKVVKSAIDSFELNYRGSKLSFSKILEEKKAEKDEQEEQIDKPEEDKSKKKKEEKWIYQQNKNIELADNALNNILNSFNPVRADSFPQIEKKSINMRPECTVTIKAYGKDIVLSIFNKQKDDDKKYICTSSESPYVFGITEWKAKKYFKTINDLKKK